MATAIPGAAILLIGRPAAGEGGRWAAGRERLKDLGVSFQTARRERFLELTEVNTNIFSEAPHARKRIASAAIVQPGYGQIVPAGE